MKTYCRGLRIDRAIVEEAYREWREAPAGKKNAWRVAHEHGSAANLIDEVAREIAERRLSFETIHRKNTEVRHGGDDFSDAATEGHG